MNDPLRRLAALVRRETGNDLPEGRLPFLREVIERRLAAHGMSDIGSYREALEAGALAGEWETLATLLTIKESSFFRVPQQWERLRAELLPELARRRASERRLRFWSAACAAGEEPGTLALVVDDLAAVSGWDWSILATDLDPEALAHAERGLYGDRAVAAVPPQLRASGFRRHGPYWELDARLRERIRYRRLNLARLPLRLPEERFDVVLLRNVLIYFRPELQRAVVDEVARHLAPDGWLFLGGSETLWRIQDRFEAVDLGECFGYRLPASRAPRRPEREARDSGELALAREPAAGAAPAARPLPARPDAVSVPAPSAADRILAAVAHLEADRPAAAEAEVAAALEADPADPGAHVLSGLLHDLAGRLEPAADAFRAALYLEPGLYQARLLLAGCLRRLGEAELAQRQYREVLSVVDRGVPRRLAALDGRLLPDVEEARRRARAALDARLR